MIEVDGRIIIGYVVAILFLFIIGRSFFKPLNTVVRLLLNCVAGVLVLFGLNVVGQTWSLGLPLNPFTALVAGFMGLPGVAWLLALKYAILP
ncbi:MAG TPA: SigmaK-factor processing regulatory BofA [Firmicutes bacterium]|nr:SigmaK-factor processing regulatory BofA [Bacillota bacterium]HAW70055.1 SigmaK-factor processing regulatory BofA [Bacillota bacterium]HAZ22855.1 SigmaK-factor processing regulatory BofA [Bacillota bacterium]HBE06990.1 SigmaK-factor processing regulatory BofA [Bacillota bacterium]HBG43833.1 SigmaK-factor processing regulatory BofA [Bacillota bacterium]